MPLNFQIVPKLKIILIFSPAGLDQPVNAAFCICLLFNNFLALSVFLLCGCISNIRMWELKDSYSGISAIFFTFLFTYKLSLCFFLTSFWSSEWFSFWAQCNLFFLLWIGLSICMSDPGISHSFPAINMQHCMCAKRSKVCPKRSLHGLNKTMKYSGVKNFQLMSTLFFALKK